VLPLPRLKSLPGLAACLLLATGIQAGDFRMEPADSRLRFRAVAEKAEFEGRFTRFDSIARFDPADLAGSRIEATVDTGSVNTANGQRDELLVGADWFASSRWPRARFVTRRIEALGDGYRAEAETSAGSPWETAPDSRAPCSCGAWISMWAPASGGTPGPSPTESPWRWTCTMYRPRHRGGFSHDGLRTLDRG
jgi:hypothetical protein